LIVSTSLWRSGDPFIYDSTGSLLIAGKVKTAFAIEVNI
jgi:hypothetical protein